ncbi:MAG: glycoside hydrolase family 97 catalytic domain-containing protein [Bacteroidales bacterium]|nr:glycoside hydrolase family 97 catalytic domain-containing protein [Candidatus Liminaster caballi]
MKTSYLSVVLALAAMSVPAMGQEVSSPDGHLRVSVSCNGGKPSYSVTLDDNQVIKDSPLGLNTTIGDFTKSLSLASASDVKTVGETYALPNAKKHDITYTANERTYTFALEDGKKIFDVVMHVDNENVAFKYVLYPKKEKRDERLACLVSSEATAYTMPEGTHTFLCPQMTPQTGFARTAPSYETYYDFDAEMGKNGHGRGFTYPALFRVPATEQVVNRKGKVTGTRQSDIWVMINETNVGGNYCGSRIEYKDNGVYAVTYPEDTEFGCVGTSAPGLMLSAKGAPTPWRTITVGRSLKSIAETTIQWDLVTPQYKAKHEYKYGRSAWSWIIRMDSSCNYDEQKEYVDFAAAMGWEYLLVDAWWDSNIGYDRMAELSRYAQKKGVGLFLWYNSNGYWNDAMQGPRGKMHRMITRREEMAWMQSAGIKGIKVDFVGSDKQQTMQMYEDILADANDYGIMVIFHGCTLQRGWERMYPNFVSCEAVRASENLAFGQYDNDIEARCGTIHPLLRNAVGNMDFGGSALNRHYSKNNERGTLRKTSDVYALATAVLFQTPVQNFAVAPNNMTDAPAWAIDFMKAVPVEWEDVRFIDGYPGKYVVMARKYQGKWYLAAINAEETARELTLDLTALFGAGEKLSLYADDAQLQGSLTEITVNSKKPLKVSIPCNGGLVIK